MKKHCRKYSYLSLCLLSAVLFTSCLFGGPDEIADGGNYSSSSEVVHFFTVRIIGLENVLVTGKTIDEQIIPTRVSYFSSSSTTARVVDELLLPFGRVSSNGGIVRLGYSPWSNDNRSSVSPVGDVVVMQGDNQISTNVVLDDLSMPITMTFEVFGPKYKYEISEPIDGNSISVKVENLIAQIEYDIAYFTISLNINGTIYQGRDNNMFYYDVQNQRVITGNSVAKYDKGEDYYFSCNSNSSNDSSSCSYKERSSRRYDFIGMSMRNNQRKFSFRNGMDGFDLVTFSKVIIEVDSYIYEIDLGTNI